MPYIPVSGGDNGGGGSDSFSYPTQRMVDTAYSMIANANTSLDKHEAAWAKLQAYVGTFPSFMQGVINAFLVPYERRLRASYQWQLDCANALLNGSEQMKQTDIAISHGFTPQGFGQE